jgi:hypothetical protein
MFFVYNSLWVRHNKRGAGIFGGGLSGCGVLRDGDPACENARFFVL